MPQVDAVQIETDVFQRDPAAWLADQSRDGMTLLLAHADDGVIWGEVRNNTLFLAGDSFPRVRVELRATTLQQARLFGPSGELRLWRTGKDSFAACLVQDSDLPQDQIIDEHQWLWGTVTEGEVNGFTLLREGEQGMLHAPPITGVTGKERVALHVKHYIMFDDAGQARINLSRLVGLQKVGGAS